MILAAGLGTRLKPLTDNTPKALVEIDGTPILGRLILNLKKQGFNYIVVNVHHFADKVKNFLSSTNFGVKISVSDESHELLDTGGGIVHAKDLLFKYDDLPFIVHNVDILSNADLPDLLKTQDGLSLKTLGIVNRNDYKEGTTLLISDRSSSRKLIFDTALNLKGWHDLQKNTFRPGDFIPSKDDRELAFSGIYAMSMGAVEEMETLMGNTGFSVMDYFLNAERRRPVSGFEQSGLKLIDIGKPATLLQASQILKDLSAQF